MDLILVVIQLLYLSPFLLLQYKSSNNQKWVNSGWDDENKRESYFSDSYNY